MFCIAKCVFLVLLVKNRLHFITKLIYVETVTDSITKLKIGFGSYKLAFSHRLPF